MSLKIRYSQCWEDADLLIKALTPQNSDRILSITSGGDNTLRLAAENPEKIVALDKNQIQNCLLELKWKAIINLDYERLMAFLGIQKSNDRNEEYNRLRETLTYDTRLYWDLNKKSIIKGILHCGKFEKYLQAFRRFFLPLTHSRNNINTLLKKKSEEEQRNYYNQHWENWRWKFLFRIFFSKPVMKKLGRSPEMFQHANISNVSEHYMAKARRALSRTTMFNNSYLEYIFRGNNEKHLPAYLQKENTEKLKKGATKIDIVSNDLLTFLKGIPHDYFTKFNLSDVFEPMTRIKTDHIFEQIFRTGKSNARMIFWNNLVKRDIPTHLKNQFQKEVSLEEELKEKDKIFFYEAFHIYTLIK